MSRDLVLGHVKPWQPLKREMALLTGWSHLTWSPSASSFPNFTPNSSLIPLTIISVTDRQCDSSKTNPWPLTLTLLIFSSCDLFLMLLLSCIKATQSVTVVGLFSPFHDQINNVSCWTLTFSQPYHLTLETDIFLTSSVKLLSWSKVLCYPSTWAWSWSKLLPFKTTKM